MKITKNRQDRLGLMGVSIDRGIMFWVAEVHICVVVLDSPGCGERGAPTGWTTTESRVIRDILTGLQVQTRIEVESESNQKTRNDSKVEMGCWGPSVRVRSGEEKYVS